jgi:uncharacterized protein Yka (UPF0111/DUF47 family)
MRLFPKEEIFFDYFDELAEKMDNIMDFIESTAVLISLYEEAIDACEKVSNIVEGIVLKYD